MFLFLARRGQDWVKNFGGKRKRIKPAGNHVEIFILIQARPLHDLGSPGWSTFSHPWYKALGKILYPVTAWVTTPHLCTQLICRAHTNGFKNWAVNTYYIELIKGSRHQLLHIVGLHRLLHVQHVNVPMKSPLEHKEKSLKYHTGGKWHQQTLDKQWAFLFLFSF